MFENRLCLASWRLCRDEANSFYSTDSLGCWGQRGENPPQLQDDPNRNIRHYSIRARRWGCLAFARCYVCDPILDPSSSEPLSLCDYFPSPVSYSSPFSLSRGSSTLLAASRPYCHPKLCFSSSRSMWMRIGISFSARRLRSCTLYSS